MGHVWAILGPCFGYFYNIFASRCLKWLKLLLISHAPQIEESDLTHIYLCNVCVSVPPKILARSGKKWQKWQKAAKVAKVSKSGKRWQKLAKIGKNWQKVAENGKKWKKVTESGNSGNIGKNLHKKGKKWQKKTKIKLAVGQRTSSIL